ncbi:hypothetical protein [Streptantibioticus silvisoli]|uniref:Uncharacterized protein n=1 Tax=Streptantibioticus silvisoli TaxID=2705255 RepID=A0ABT6W4Q1_9ACTN|nr:hypothetical protein [Streptantibioticus silvisoli]MDI5965720.1 hypothetical protein [Streptantibioticus silvisoli]
MRQRNTTGSAWTVAGDTPQRIEVGGTLDHSVLLDGWSAIDDEPPTRAPMPDPKPSKRNAADTEGGEPQ